MLYWVWMAVTLILATATLFSALGKLRRIPRVVDMLHHVGVNDQQITILGWLGVLAAFGLTMGLILVPYLAPVTAAALAVYYLVAAIVHWRAGDKFPIPPLVLFLLSVASLVLGLA